MNRWREAYWCYFLVFLLPHPVEIFLPTPTLSLSITVLPHPLEIFLLTKFVKTPSSALRTLIALILLCIQKLLVPSGLGHSYKLTKILLKLPNIFFIDKIAGSKVY